MNVTLTNTLTPWQLSSSGRVEPINAPRYELNDGWIICDCRGPDAEANAALIVRAVNSYAAMQTALSDLADVAGAMNARQHAGFEITPAEWNELYAAQQHARTALAGTSQSDAV